MEPNPRKCPSCGVNWFHSSRHCLDCGFTKPVLTEDALRLGLIKPHKKPEPNSGEALISLMEKFGLTLPKNAIEWRPMMVTGQHPLYRQDVTVLCTDGVVAWYAVGVGFEEDLSCFPPTFFGHFSNFTENESEAEEKDKPPREAKVPAKTHTRNVRLAESD